MRAHIRLGALAFLAAALWSAPSAAAPVAVAVSADILGGPVADAVKKGGHGWKGGRGWKRKVWRGRGLKRGWFKRRASFRYY